MATKRLEFFEPASFWTQALPLGNGHLGAMVWGGLSSELLQLNEGTLWSGGPKDWNNPQAAQSLQDVRDLVWSGQFAKATALAQSKMLGPDQGQVYQPLGNMKLDFGDSQGFDHSLVVSGTYMRELDLDTAMARVSYKLAAAPNSTEAAGERGSHDQVLEYNREAFASHPDHVVVMSVRASAAACVSCAISLDSQLPSQVEAINSMVAAVESSIADASVPSRQRIVLQGQCPGNISAAHFSTQQVGECSTSIGMKFAAVLEIRVVGDKASVIAQNGTVMVKYADSVVLVLAASSSYDGPFKDPSTSDVDPVAKSLALIESLANISYSSLLARHLQDYQPLFQRVSLELSSQPAAVDHQTDIGAVDFAKSTSKFTGKSTKERIEGFAKDEDPNLICLLFNFGRYLMIASSRPGSLATNLQGIWSKDLHPAWGCTPHTNINLQMNYWPAEICNLPDCHLPLFDLISVLAINGSATAKVNYNKSGWVAHHIVDIWGLTAPCSGDPVYALWPMGGAWLCTHLWEHYLFSLDKKFLSEVAFPLIKGCTEFLLDWLVELDFHHGDDDGSHGQKVYLVTNPATSPEHEFIAPDGQRASVSYATTMDMAIVREVFSSFVSASHVLADSTNIDATFLQRVTDASTRLLPPQIGSDGLLMEWALPFQDPDTTHRHMSHLFGLYPGHSLSLQTTPELCDAAVQSIIKRGKVGPGWSTAWKTALWARLGNGSQAYEMVKQMFNYIDDTQTEESLSGGGLYGNLFCAHPPFQIDGNFGFTAAVAEMFVQSDLRNIYLLPALGDKWTDGEVYGLRARGGIKVSKLSWISNKLNEVGVEVDNKQSLRLEPLTLHYGDVTTELKLMQPGIVYLFDGALAAKA